MIRRGGRTTNAHIDVCIAEKVKLVVFHLNVPPKMWVDRLRAGAKVWMQCASVEQALDAAALGVDAIIAQGTEAGGHTKSTTRMVQARSRDRRCGSSDHGAGGGRDADSEKVVSALSHGAEGVWVGTRLIASTEAYAHPEHQRRILAASGNDSSVITTMFGPEYPNRTCRVLRGIAS